MADDGAAEEAPVTFHVKSPSDAKYTVTVPLSHTVLQLKEKLSTTEYADLPPERQRLIYSGRVLKDPDTLASYKIKEGNTVHLVKGAASNQRQNPASQGTAASNPVNPAVPTNLSSGPGANNPLAGLTGARYAGLAHLPNQAMFGPDGGMGPPPDPEQIIQLLENPQFASTLSEALSNPQIVESMIQQNPMLREMGPEMRQIMQSPEFRRMMTDPQMMRTTMQMQRAFGGGPFGGRAGSNAFPAPGATDTTPNGAQASDGQGNQQQQQAPMMNPFAMFGGQAGGNPFASLFNPAAAAAAANAAGNQAPNNAASGTQPSGNEQQPPGANPLFNPALFAQMLGTMGAQQQQQQQQQQQRQQAAQTEAAPGSTNAAGGAPATGGANDSAAPGSTSPPPPTANPAMNPAVNPLYSAMMQLFDPNNAAHGGAGGGAPGAPTPADLAQLWGYPGAAGGAAGTGLFGGLAQPAAPPDTRPPEERYADQLRQLNDMGFYNFERNIEALRRSGGSVQGAVEYLLSTPE